MVYERVRGWTSGRSLPVQNFVKNPPPPRVFCDVIFRQNDRFDSHPTVPGGGKMRDPGNEVASAPADNEHK